MTDSNTNMNLTDSQEVIDTDAALDALEQEFVLDFAITTSNVKQAGKGGFEGYIDRGARLRDLLGDGNFFEIGQLFATRYNGRRIADIVMDGGSVPAPGSITLNGIKYTLAPGQSFSLASIESWGCPGCGSASGTGVHPSPKKARSADTLSQVQFYLAPVTGLIFSFSGTCWGRYVKGQGLAGKFILPPTPKPVRKGGK